MYMCMCLSKKLLHFCIELLDHNICYVALTVLCHVLVMSTKFPYYACVCKLFRFKVMQGTHQFNIRKIVVNHKRWPIKQEATVEDLV